MYRVLFGSSVDIAFPILDKAGSWKEYISRLKSEGVDITMVRDEYGNVRGIVYTAEDLSFAGKKWIRNCHSEI